MKASGTWRPVIDLSTLNLRIQQTSFKMETLQSVLLYVRPGDWIVSLDLKDAYLQVPMHLESRKFLRFMVGGEGVPVQSSLLWTLHGSTIFHQGHGSCVSYSSQDEGTASPVPRQLVAPGFLTRAGPPCSEDSAPALQVSGDRRQLREVSGDSNTTDGLSGGHSELNYFQGFSCPEESREASLNWRRILVLRQSACFILARAFRSAVLDDPARARGSSPYEVSPACSTETVGSCGSVPVGQVVSRDPAGS